MEGYLAAYARNGVYDDQQFRHCFELIDKGLQLPDRSSCHEKLRKLSADLERQQAELHGACGTQPAVDNNSPWFQFRSGNFSPIIARYAELKKTVVPCGILGPPEEKELWDLSEFMIRISLMNGKIQDALARLSRYEAGRLSVRLTPMPAFDLQESILGYLSLHESTTAARTRLKFWLENSRMPIVSDVIRNHPEFAGVCPARSP